MERYKKKWKIHEIKKYRKKTILIFLKKNHFLIYIYIYIYIYIGKPNLFGVVNLMIKNRIRDVIEMYTLQIALYGQKQDAPAPISFIIINIPSRQFVYVKIRPNAR